VDFTQSANVSKCQNPGLRVQKLTFNPRGPLHKGLISSATPLPGLWPILCSETGMKTIAFKVHGKSGDFVRASLVPANHSEEAHFGLIDGAVIAFFLISVCSLGYLFLH
jgi:hypothetical protein